MLIFKHYFSILKSESLAIADLGAAIYDALDYSLGRDEQRTLSGSLENLIDKMTSADEDCEDGGDDDDEGIDDYEGVIKQSGQCTMVLDLCRYTRMFFFLSKYQSLTSISFTVVLLLSVYMYLAKSNFLFIDIT